MGPPGSAIWNAMVEAAERILIEEGYAALTSRGVAERIGVKQRLVYYYFHTMDDLIVATFRAGCAKELERLEKALTSKDPVGEMWDVYVHTSDARLISEYMALSNRIEALRVEVKKHIEASRKLHVAALTKAMGGKGKRGDLPPVAAAIFATSAALALHREAKLGVRTGHAEIKAVINSFLGAKERGAKRPRKTASAA
jgi:AcrR family transcriptional regulator